MFRRNARWTWLTILALANVVCWFGVAAAIGLVVGEKVDLGVETFLREGQATAVVLWSQAAQRAFRPTNAPTAEAQPPSSASTAIAQSNPPSGGTELASSSALPGRQPETGPVATQSVPATSSAGVLTPTPQPQTTLVSEPLLLADPEISSLAHLDAEMNRSATGRAVQIRYQEEALNSEIAALWKNNPELPFRNVRVDLQRDRVVVTGKATILGFGVNARIEGTVDVEDCLPQLKIDSVSVAGVMTPKFVKDKVEDMILEAMTWYPADYPLCLEQIVLEETRASVYGYRR